VALDRRNDHELVPTHDQQMAARIAWEALMKLENVAIEFVQVSQLFFVNPVGTTSPLKGLIL